MKTELIHFYKFRLFWMVFAYFNTLTYNKFNYWLSNGHTSMWHVGNIIF